MLSKSNLELIFEVVQHATGEYTASCLNARIGDSRCLDLRDLNTKITEAVDRYFEGCEKPPPSAIHLMFVQDSPA